MCLRSTMDSRLTDWQAACPAGSLGLDVSPLLNALSNRDRESGNEHCDAALSLLAQGIQRRSQSMNSFESLALVGKRKRDAQQERRVRQRTDTSGAARAASADAGDRPLRLEP